MSWLCNRVIEAGTHAIADLICPTQETRAAFGDAVILVGPYPAKPLSRYRQDLRATSSICCAIRSIGHGRLQKCSTILGRTSCFFEVATDAQIIDLIKTRQKDHALYDVKLATWGRHFPGRLKLWFYDQLCEDPERLFLDVCEFLGISPNAHFENNKIHERVHAGSPNPMPDAVRRYLSSQLRPEIVALRFDNRYTQRWLESLSDG